MFFAFSLRKTWIFRGCRFQLGCLFKRRLRRNSGCRSPTLLWAGILSSWLLLLVGANFELSVASVGLILQATIGGAATDFRVCQLSDRVFRFTVSSEPVGFYIYNLFSFECKLYKLFFHLWGNGGPNWHFEFQLFLDEEERSWEKSAPRGQQKKSFAEVVKSTPLSGANAVPVGRRSVFTRIRQPSSSHSGIHAHSTAACSAAGRPAPEKTSHSQSVQISSSNLNFCSRCLSSDHLRNRCARPIRCRASARAWAGEW